MQFSFQRFFLVATSVVTTISVAAEPCSGPLGKYDPAACDACATGGKGKGQCCEDIYYNSNGRDDDWFRDSPDDGGCVKEGKSCDVKEGACAPGLTCTRPCTVSGTETFPQNNYGKYTCETHPYPNTACNSPTGGFSLLNEFSATRNADGGGPSFGLVVVGLLGAALMARKVVTSRHSSVAIRRHQYSEVDATTTPPLSV